MGIRKAMVQICELSQEKPNAQAFNQITRWISTKETHASKIVALVSEYCLCQRVKPVGAPKSPFTSQDEYVAALRAHHAALLTAVKCKQVVDVSDADALAIAVNDMCRMYTPTTAPNAGEEAVAHASGDLT